MKTNANIRKSKKWAILFFVLVVVSAQSFAQPGASKSGNDDLTSVIRLEQLMQNTELTIRFTAPAVNDLIPDGTIEKTEDKVDQYLAVDDNTDVPVILVGNSQQRSAELNSNFRSNPDVIQVGYFQKCRTSVWYKLRKAITTRPVQDCNVCARFISTSYTMNFKPIVK
jgi:hypothetical protein